MSDEGCGCLIALALLGAAAYGAFKYLPLNHEAPKSAETVHSPPPLRPISDSGAPSSPARRGKQAAPCAVIARIPVSSSSIRSIGYCAQQRTLEVEFERGSVYRYWGVSQRTFDAFLSAPSKGQFFDYAIRNEPYGYARVR
jgi:hypothetical protein